MHFLKMLEIFMKRPIELSIVTEYLVEFSHHVVLTFVFATFLFQILLFT